MRTREDAVEPALTLTDTPDPQLKELCHAIFTADAAAKAVPSDFHPLAVHFERDGILLGGLLGRTLRGWLFVETLALPHAEQGHGYGKRLLEMAEAEAMRRGCVGTFLNTDVFMAPGFYERLGYRECGRLEHPTDPRLTRIWLSRRF